MRNASFSLGFVHSSGESCFKLSVVISHCEKAYQISKALQTGFHMKYDMM